MKQAPTIPMSFSGMQRVGVALPTHHRRVSAAWLARHCRASVTQLARHRRVAAASASETAASPPQLPESYSHNP